MVGPSTDVWAYVHAERHALIDDLSVLDAQQWETASLCDGWAVRDVVAHVAATAGLSKRGFAREIVRAGFSVERIVQRQIAAGRGSAPADLVESLRRSVNSTACPPLPVISRVVEIVVHGEDIRRPLGLRHIYATDQIGAAIAYAAGRRLAGVRFVGTDAEVSVGSGPIVTGSVVSLLLAVCGRRIALPELSGPGVNELARRI